MLTLLHLPSPLWKFPSPNVTEKPPEIHLFFIQSKIPFDCTESVAFKSYFHNIKKKLSSSFWEKVENHDNNTKKKKKSPNTESFLEWLRAAKKYVG